MSEENNAVESAPVKGNPENQAIIAKMKEISAQKKALHDEYIIDVKARDDKYKNDRQVLRDKMAALKKELAANRAAKKAASASKKMNKKIEEPAAESKPEDIPMAE